MDDQYWFNLAVKCSSILAALGSIYFLQRFSERPIVPVKERERFIQNYDDKEDDE